MKNKLFTSERLAVKVQGNFVGINPEIFCKSLADHKIEHKITIYAKH